MLFKFSLFILATYIPVIGLFKWRLFNRTINTSFAGQRVTFCSSYKITKNNEAQITIYTYIFLSTIQVCHDILTQVTVRLKCFLIT